MGLFHLSACCSHMDCVCVSGGSWLPLGLAPGRAAVLPGPQPPARALSWVQAQCGTAGAAGAHHTTGRGDFLSEGEGHPFFPGCPQNTCFLKNAGHSEQEAVSEPGRGRFLS